MPLGPAEITTSCGVVLTGFVLFVVSLFVPIPLSAEKKRDLESVLASASMLGELLSFMKRRLQELRRQEVVSAALEIGSDVRIKKKAHTRKGKVKNKKASSAVFRSMGKMPCKSEKVYWAHIRGDKHWKRVPS